jgi:hypothetical protein
MDHAHVSYRSHNIVLLSTKGLAVMFPCTVRMLGTHSCDVLLSYMWCTKQLIFFPYSYSGSVEMLNCSDPPSTHLLLDLSFGIGSLLVVKLPLEPLLEFETFVVSKGISSVVVGNSQIDVYDAYMS